MKYLRLICSRAFRETRKHWTPQKMWIAFASPIVTVPSRGIFYGWTAKDLWFTVGITLLVVAAMWAATFLFNLIRSPALIHNEQQIAIATQSNTIERLESAARVPALSTRQQASLDFVQELLQGAPDEAERRILNCILDHGEIEAYQLEKTVKDRDAIARSLEKWLHKLISERVEPATNRTSYSIIPGHKTALELALASRDQPAS